MLEVRPGPRGSAGRIPTSTASASPPTSTPWRGPRAPAPRSPLSPASAARRPRARAGAGQRRPVPAAARRAPLGVVGRLGGIGARPEMTGLVSDADGAVAALATAAKSSTCRRGDARRRCDHRHAHLPERPDCTRHDPVPFMDSPVDIATMNRHEVTGEMEAALSVDTTQGQPDHQPQGPRPVAHRQGGAGAQGERAAGELLAVAGPAEPLVTHPVTTPGHHPVRYRGTSHQFDPAAGHAIARLRSSGHAITPASAGARLARRPGASHETGHRGGGPVRRRDRQGLRRRTPRLPRRPGVRRARVPLRLPDPTCRPSAANPGVVDHRWLRHKNTAEEGAAPRLWAATTTPCPAFRRHAARLPE
ncbi:DUF1177 domain-containing protein [Streptomyces thinghirensis]|nr:DUF1177 domain-containing protein [Streptomyces thinghirensis]